jgi:tetratricopeptide (TPR) repeat protein
VAKIGRNDPCPCGSGKKYKKCCEPRDQALAAERARTSTLSARSAMASALQKWLHHEDDLDRASNSVVDLIKEGRLDEAEQAAQRLLRDYPEVHDGFERLGMVYEARGDRGRAVEMY